MDISMRENETFLNRPVTMNSKNNLLQIEEHMYILDDVKKPNVFRNMFPYSEVPKIPFNDRIVPVLEKEGIIINDLYSVIAQDIDRYICDDKTHLSPEGIEVAANHVANFIKQVAEG